MPLKAAALAGLLAWHPFVAVTQDGQAPQATFRGGVNLVAVSVVVRDEKGQIVGGLTRDDFELFDNGLKRSISQFRSDTLPVSLAILIDASGSMAMPPRMSMAAEALHHLTAWLTTGGDEVGLFAFDTRLVTLEPFTTDPSRILDRLAAVKPFGQTSLFDAIAGTARELIAHGGPRRAVVVLTDSDDNSSRLTPAEVSRLASSLDVPVYVLALTGDVGRLETLGASTGGQVFKVTATNEASVAARQIVDELRHGYLLAFEPGATPGWHPLAVKTRDKKLIVRARDGYIAGPRPAWGWQN